MKRKVIQIADSTQLVSLPMKWTRQFGVKKGDELEVEISGSKLIIYTEKTPTLNDISLDVSKLDRTATMFYLRSAYRRGFDSIKVKFDHPTTHHYRKNSDVSYIHVLNSEVNRLVGLEIIKQTENSCDIKDFSRDHSTEFDSMIRKIFLQINDAMDDLIKGAKNKDIELLRTIKEKHDSITKFVSYCLRLLNRKSHYESSKSHVIYYIIGNLDLITDIIKYSARDIIKYNKKFNKESICICELIGKTVRTYYDMFYKFDLKKMSDIIKLRDEILLKIDLNAKKVPVKELLMLNDLKTIADILREISEARTQLEHKAETQ